jgi:DNA-binding response OmpR family regulator
VTDWFRAFMDAAPEVYFRFALVPARRFAYVSRAAEAFTGHKPDAFYSDPALCVPLVVHEDRKVLRQILRARRPLTSTLRLHYRDGSLVRLVVRTVPVVRGHQLVAVEGVATGAQDSFSRVDVVPEPVQQRLAALLHEVHGLLHGALPLHGSDGAESRADGSEQVLRLGGIAVDTRRLAVTLDGKPVAVTGRELQVLRYLLERQDRVVTRDQMLREVWDYRYTGDARTVDVHISRLRRKLPPLARMLRAVKHVGYCLDGQAATPAADRRIANI